MEIARELLDLVLHLDQHLDQLIRSSGAATYAILFLIIFCETGLVVTPFLPGDSLLFAAGALAARGSLQLWWLMGLLSVAAVAGDALNYWIGRSFGARIFSGRGRRLVKQEYYDRTHEFFERHGARTIILARFAPVFRTFAPFVAGVGRMTYRRFALYNVSGGLLWIGAFVLGGYLFGNLPVVRRHFSLVVLGVIIVSVMPIVASLWQERRRGRAPV
jgi:membrane-associated protein